MAERPHNANQGVAAAAGGSARSDWLVDSRGESCGEAEVAYIS